ncbi:MAG: YraN family protein, partial [Verrucomicrobiota bacterium]
MDLLRTIGEALRRLSSCLCPFNLPWRERCSSDPKAFGREGEKRAELFLKKQGYKILYHNFRPAVGGEVDLVCRDRQRPLVIFVEVKSRKTEEHGAPSSAVNRPAIRPMTTATATLAALRSGQLKGITRLDLACNLQEFPREIFDLAETLEVLNLSGNALSALPDDLSRLSKLRVIFCSDNRFTQLPEVLSSCPQLEMVGFKANRIREVAAAAISPGLRWLILTDNQVSSLPDSVGSCARLQKLMLAGNQLADLPEAMRGCIGLELLRISANRFETLPDWLLQLPRLTWLAFGGNPVSAAPHVPNPAVARLPWSELELAEKLGEGASGVIHKAHWQPSLQDARHPVAVKLFKGAVTSDGFPAEEMAACLAAGDHAHLIGVIGVLTGHPAGTSGLVMPWVDPGFRNLAGPPNLATCTRDIYGD